MGRTVMPFTQALEAERRRWQKFRRALRQADQKRFDQLFEMARRHTQAGAYSAMPLPWQSMGLAMLLELLRGEQRLLRRLKRLEQRLDEKTNHRLPVRRA